MVDNGNSLQQYPVDAGIPQAFTLGLAVFVLYINYPPDDVILLSMLMILDSIVSAIRHLIDGNNLSWLLTLNLTHEIRQTGAGGGFFTSMLGKLSFFFLSIPILLMLLMSKWVSLFLNNNDFLSYWDSFSSKFDWGSRIISIAKTTSKKIEALILSLKFLSPEFSVYVYKSTTRPFLKYFCHFMMCLSSYYVNMLDKVQNRISKTVGPLLSTSLEPLAHRRNKGSSSLFFVGYTYIDIHQNLLNRFHVLLFVVGHSLF